MLRERRRHAHYKLNGRLDRKSSRGMIYENEELRLRTININAEVERGQSDIRKLRRENEQLRREIWSLRDEYDRLNKRFKANKYLPDSISEHGQSESNSEDSDSCDTCRGEGDSNDECLTDRKQQHRDSYSPPPAAAATTDAAAVTTYDRCTGSIQEPTTTGTFETNESGSSATKPRDNLHVLFDHLSIVSEENLSNSDGNLTQADASNLSPSQCLGAMSLPSLIGPSAPLTPIELVANQLNDLQSCIPPLSYFENIVKQHSTIDSTASTNTGETVIQTNGWDYNIQSPFSARKFQPSEASSSNSTSTTMSPSHASNPIPVRERESTPQPDVSTNPNSSCTEGSNHKPHKHFFSPIKPRLKLDTALAARAAILNPPTVLYPDLTQPKYDPPDVYITNALASPYYPQSIAGLSLPSVLVPPMQHAPPYIEPIYATAQKKPQLPDQSQAGGESSKSSINLEQILNEIGTITEDILQLQLEKSRSQERLLADNQYLPASSSSSSSAAPFHTATTHTQTVSPNSSPTNHVKEQPTQSMPSDKNRKPYRSEMNLFLSYSGSNPVIVPIAKGATATGECSSSTQAITSDGAALDDEGAPDREGNSPSPPQLPTPMAPFPTNLMYLAFDRVNPALVEASDSRFGLQKVGLAYVPPVSADNHQRVVSPAPSQPPPPPPPLPPALSYACSDQSDEPIGFRIRDQEALTLSSPDLSTSPLAAIAPLKRRIFSKQHDDSSNSHQITRSFDGGDVATISGDSKRPETGNLSEAGKLKTALEGSVNEISSYESSSGSEATKRKSSRRVSIVCRDDNKADPTPSEAVDQHQNQQQQHQSTVSVDRLDDIMPSILGNQKHAHSTPNSPHSNRRRGNTNSAISATSSTLHHHGHHHHHHHHHHSRKLSQESINDTTARGTSVANSIVNSSPDNVGPTASTSAHQHPARYKCSRRHSDGTVASVIGGGAGLRLSGASSHHHHHHHVDSAHETATSISERNSGSLASSRESSTSLSMRSQRRKISVSSHTGGKIPWCGCWGNGCL